MARGPVITADALQCPAHWGQMSGSTSHRSSLQRCFKRNLCSALYVHRTIIDDPVLERGSIRLIFFRKKMLALAASPVDNIIMYDKNKDAQSPGLIGSQIRQLRLSRGWSLTELAKRAGTSAPALHRYESGWDRFEVATLRKLASALGARLEIRLVVAEKKPPEFKAKPQILVRLLSSLFWDKTLSAEDLTEYPKWVLGRVLTLGTMQQVRAARKFFGDSLLQETLALRAIDEKTRNYWTLILSGEKNAS